MSGKSGVNFDLKKKSDTSGIVSGMMSGITGVRSTEKNLFSTKGIVSETMSGKSGVNSDLKKKSDTSGIVSGMEIPKRRRIVNNLELDPITDITPETTKRKTDLKTTFDTPTKRPTREPPKIPEGVKPWRPVPKPRTKTPMQVTRDRPVPKPRTRKYTSSVQINLVKPKTISTLSTASITGVKQIQTFPMKQAKPTVKSSVTINLKKPVITDKKPAITTDKETQLKPVP
jgi:hypothetical protein